MLIKTIQANKVEWYDADDLDPKRAEIQKILLQLEGLVMQYESRWGGNVLQDYCNPDLRKRFDSQCEKFEDALYNSDVELVRELASGFIRAYKALEDDVLASGAYDPDYAMAFSDAREGQEIIVCANVQDCALIQKKRPDAAVWSMLEVSNLIRSREATPTKQITVKAVKEFDFKEGDTVPF